MLALSYLDHTPQIDPSITADDWVTIIGRTEIGAGCYFGKLSTLRGDGEHIRVGSECWFGEASTVHIADSIYGARVGSHVTVGRFGLVHACTIGDHCVLGEHAVVMDNSVIVPIQVPSSPLKALSLRARHWKAGGCMPARRPNRWNRYHRHGLRSCTNRSAAGRKLTMPR